MNQYTEIVQMVKDMVGIEYLYFSTALEVKKTPHLPAFYGWGVCVSPTGTIYVMDSWQQWHSVEEGDALMIPSLYQRVKLLSKPYKTA